MQNSKVSAIDGINGRDTQSERFKEAARKSGADIGKEEFASVIGGLAKPKPEDVDYGSSKTKPGSPKRQNDE